ncbi:MAG: Gfo/Idh/MocA family oxidoreductase, partial [Spirochaetales bacterium]|nr:Gfo/Idh/MocA family oxidoreductase [Spirochaetales bacterium]
MIKLGFIGCGGITSYHADTIKSEVKGIKIAAGADIDDGTRKSFGDTFREAALFADYKQMLKRADIDAVCVALPTYLHREAVVHTAKAGLHVFCEKPMARSLRDCDIMIDACDKAGVRLMIGQVRRYDTDWGTWKKIIDSGTLGRPVIWRQTQGSSPPGAWYMDEKKSGGPFIDGCVHNWDFANLVFGKPTYAYGHLMNISGSTAFDTGSATVLYEQGDQVVLNWSWGLPAGVRTPDLTDILGPKGALSFPGSFSEDEFPENFDREVNGGYLVSIGTRKRIAKFRRHNMFAAEWADFRTSINKNTTPAVTGRIGRDAVEVALAVLKAGRTGKP